MHRRFSCGWDRGVCIRTARGLWMPRQIQTRTEDGDRRLHGGLCSRAKAWMADIPAEHWLADQGYDTL